MTLKTDTSENQLACTAFDHARRIASGSYVRVALAIKEHMRVHTDASVLIFDDATGQQIDFDLRGSDEDISARIVTLHGSGGESRRAAGRPKIGVIAREVTLLPRHWEWLAEQPGGASVTLRKIVEDARRAGDAGKGRLRKLHERTYRFMSAMAGNLPNFEEASRSLFANDMPRLGELISEWPADIRTHIFLLCTDAALNPQKANVGDTHKH
jgi:uncharacterized protein